MRTRTTLSGSCHRECSLGLVAGKIQGHKKASGSEDWTVGGELLGKTTETEGWSPSQL